MTPAVTSMAAHVARPTDGRPPEWTLVLAEACTANLSSRTVPGATAATWYNFDGSSEDWAVQAPTRIRWVPYEFWLHRATDHPGDSDRDLRREAVAGTGARHR